MPRVRVLGGMRRALGAREVETAARGVREAVRDVAGRAGGALAPALWADPAAAEPEPHGDLRVLVNGRSIEFLDGLETRLEDDDTVTLHWSGARGFPGG